MYIKNFRDPYSDLLSIWNDHAAALVLVHMWTNIFKGTVLWKQGPLKKFVRLYRFDGTYSNLHRDRDHTSVVLEY